MSDNASQLGLERFDIEDLIPGGISRLEADSRTKVPRRPADVGTRRSRAFLYPTIFRERRQKYDGTAANPGV